MQELEWKESYENLVNEKRPQFIGEDENDENQQNKAEITLEEVKNNKSADLGGIPPELIKYSTD